MVRNEKERLDTWITREGPLATISGGIWLRGQFSMLIICRLLQRTSSYGRLWSSWLSLIYRDSRFSSVPVIRFNKVIKQNIFPSAPRCSNLVLDILSGTHGTVTLCFDPDIPIILYYIIILVGLQYLTYFSRKRGQIIFSSAKIFQFGQATSKISQ